MDRCQPKEGSQALRWPERRRPTPGIDGRRYLLQKRQGVQLCRLRTMAQGQAPRSNVSVGDERETIAKNPWLPITSSSLWLHRCQVGSAAVLSKRWI